MSNKTTEVKVPSFGKWLPIETAPKDGCRVDLWAGEREPNCSWRKPVGREDWTYEGITGATWRDNGGNTIWEPTHWMPLPEPPSAGDFSSSPEPQVSSNHGSVTPEGERL